MSGESWTEFLLRLQSLDGPAAGASFQLITFLRKSFATPWYLIIYCQAEVADIVVALPVHYYI